MRTLVIGSGGREHAIVKHLLDADPLREVIAAPGNPGIALLCPVFPVEVTDVEGLVELATLEEVGIAIVGPEIALDAGAADLLRGVGVAVLAPGADGARLETSKAWAKDLMVAEGIPTATAHQFTNSTDALAYLADASFPLVVKADGLAAGKGAIVCRALEDAQSAVREMLDDNVFGTAGALVLIEEFLFGDEYSMMIFTDGETILPMPLSQDHKPLGVGDTGPNTGGMGSYAPVGIEGAAELSIERIFRPLLGALRAADIDYRGVITGNLIWTAKGPYVIEFNARFGDPEAEATLPLLVTDLREITLAVDARRLGSVAVEWADDSALCIVMTADGYPATVRCGDEISGIEAAEQIATVYHAGTSILGGRIVTSGGRVLVVTGVGATFAEARDHAYKGVALISFPGGYYRSDIGSRPNSTRLAELAEEDD